MTRRYFAGALFTALATLAQAAGAETLKGDHVACLTESKLDEVHQAVARNDKRGFAYLMDNGCIITKGGIPISVLDTTWDGKAKVRAYMGNDAVVIWTVRENIKP